MAAILKLRDRQLAYGMGMTEFPLNVNPIIHSVILMHKTYPISHHSAWSGSGGTVGQAPDIYSPLFRKE
jgi:hypothetical protein